MGDRARAAARTGAVLRRGPVVVVLAVGVEPVLVVVELRVLDHQLAAGVRPRVAERVVLRPHVVDGLVAHLLAGADVEPRVVEVAGVVLVPGAAAPVAREDPVLGGGRLVLVEGARRGQVRAVEAPAADLPAAVAAVPPDLVAGAARAAEEVARGQVLDRHAVGLVHHDPVEAELAAAPVGGPEVLVGGVRAALRRAGLGPVDDHGVAVHPPQGHVGRRHQHGRRRVRRIGRSARAGRLVVARRHQDPVARLGGRRPRPGSRCTGRGSRCRCRRAARRRSRRAPTARPRTDSPSRPHTPRRMAILPTW